MSFPKKEMAPTGEVGATSENATSLDFIAFFPPVLDDSAQRATVLAAATHLRVPLFRGARASTPEAELYDITGLWLKPSQAAEPSKAKPKHDGWAITAYGDRPEQRAGFKPTAMVLLNIDIDEGNLGSATVAHHVRTFFGPHTVACIYSTASSLPEAKRWRVVIPLSAPVGVDEWLLVSQAFAAYMQTHGVTLDASMNRSTQLAFTPNVPMEQRDPFTGVPYHFEHLYWGSKLLDPNALSTPAAMSALRSVAEAEAQAEAEREAQRQLAQQKAAERQTQRQLAQANGGDGLTPVKKFNLATDVETLLREYGYAQNPDAVAQWRSPYQTRGTFATLVREDGSWFSLSGSDAAKGLGTKQGDGVGGDAFDLLVHFKYGGNRDVAVASEAQNQAMGNAFTGEPVPEGGMPAPADAPYVPPLATAPPPKAFRSLSADEFMSMPPVAWYVKDVLPTSGVAVIYGKSGSGKTFLTLDLMFSLLDEQRAEWCGGRIRNRPTGVMYLAMEGAVGVRGRVRAWCMDTGRAAPKNMRFIGGESFNLSLAPDVEALVAEVKKHLGGNPIIVIDTLAKASIGLEEQSAKDMSLAFAAADQLANATNGLCIMVAHAGKDDAKGLRGSSAQTAAADNVILVSRDGDTRSWEVEKNKDGTDGKSGYFELQSVPIGVDQYGDTVSSATVVHTEKPLPETSKAKRFSPNDQIAVEAFQIARSRAGTDTVSFEAWRQAFYERHPSDKPDTKRKAFSHGTNSLIGSGSIQDHGGGFYGQAMGAVLPPLIGLSAPPGVGGSPPISIVLPPGGVVKPPGTVH